METDLESRFDAVLMESITLREEELFNRLCSSLELDFLDRVVENQPYVKKMSDFYPLLLITSTLESGSYEPAYIFADGIGMYYTIEGIKGTLLELDL